MRASLHSVKGQQVGANGEISSEDNIPANRRVDLALPGDQMYQRWLVDRIHQRKELCFERGALSSLTGYLTGLDETSYSISTTNEFPPRSYVLPRHTVTCIHETGRSLHEMDQGYQTLIKRYTRKPHQLAAEELIPSQRMRPSTDRPRQNSI